MSTVRQQLKDVEERLASVGPSTWFDIEVWKREQAEGISLDEEERRRLAEFPEYAESIRETYAKVRVRVAEVDALPEADVPAEGEPFIDRDGNLTIPS